MESSISLTQILQDPKAGVWAGPPHRWGPRSGTHLWAILAWTAGPPGLPQP